MGLSNLLAKAAMIQSDAMAKFVLNRLSPAKIDILVMSPETVLVYMLVLPPSLL